MSGMMASVYDQNSRPLYAQHPPVVVHRPAAQLPQTAQAPLFQVRGGQVRLLQLLADFEVAADATASNLTATANPASGLTDVALHTANAIGSTAIHTLKAMSLAGLATALSSGGACIGLNQPINLDIGTLDALTSGSNAAARVAWYLMYEAITPGANVIPVSAAGVGLSGLTPRAASPFRRWVKRRAATLPATGQAPIFRVTGGPVLLWGLIGRVMTVADATTTTLIVVANPSSGVTDVNLNTATDIASLAVGNFVSIAGTAHATALGVGGAPASMQAPRIIDTGTIDLLTGDTNATAAIEWTAIWQKFHPAGNLIVA